MNKLKIEYESIEWTTQKIIDSENSIDWNIFCKYFKAKIEKTWNLDEDIKLYYFDFFYLFEEKINWSAICKNNNIHWKHILGTIFTERLNKNFRQNYSFTDENIYNEKTKLSSLVLKEKINLFSMYFHRWDWNTMSSNQNIPTEIWTSIFTNPKYKKSIAKLDFYKLSSLVNFPWNLDLYFQEKNSVLDFSENWNWDEIVTNKSIVWNKKMIIDHAKHFPWHGQSGGSTGKYWYKTSILTSCSHINFPCEVLKKYTNNWVEGMYDGCERSDSEGDWIVFSRNHKINIYILKEFSSKLDLIEVAKNKINWTIDELILMKNIIIENSSRVDEIFRILIKNEKIKELILIEKLKEL